MLMRAHQSLLLRCTAHSGEQLKEIHMKSKLIIASALAAALAAPVMAQTYGSGSSNSGSSMSGSSSGSSMSGSSHQGSAPPPGVHDTRDAQGRNTMCSAKDKMKDGTCKPGAKRVSDGS